MSGVGPLVIDTAERRFTMRGRGMPQVADELRAMFGVKAYPVAGRWSLPVAYLADVAAWLDYKNVRYRIEGDV